MEDQLAYKHKTISVVMAAYNAQDTVGPTLEHIINDQTYKNLEVIVVNDCSSDGTEAVVKKYQKNHSNIRLITLDKNSGPYKARIIGADAATGDFLHFIDADDYLSKDFYRSTLQKAVATDADIVIGSIILDHKDTDEIKDFPLINDLPFERLEKTAIFDMFVRQSGFNFIYHMNSTKLYNMQLWHRARPHYDTIVDHLIMADDVAMNVPLWYYARSLERVPSATLFYVKDDNDSATSNFKMSFKKMEKNIKDLQNVFGFFGAFIREKSLDEKYGIYLDNWKKSFVRVYENNISLSQLNSSEQAELKAQLYEIAPFNKDETSLDTPLFNVNAPWNNGLDDCKSKIIDPKIDTVIFSFNTLFLTRTRPDQTHEYSLRKTGLEIYNLALHENKRILFTDFPTDISLGDFDDFIQPHEMNQSTEQKGRVAQINLPLPMDIFSSHKLDAYIIDEPQPTSKDDKIILETLANYYFDNPFLALIKGSLFNGRPTFLGYYAIGPSKLTPVPEQAASSTILLNLLSEDATAQEAPYDAFFIQAVNHGTAQFVNAMNTADNHFEPSSLIAIASKALHTATNSPSWADTTLLSPLTCSDTLVNNHSAQPHPASRRDAVFRKTKRLINRSTSHLPIVNRTIRKSYKTLRRLKRQFTN